MPPATTWCCADRLAQAGLDQDAPHVELGRTVPGLEPGRAGLQDRPEDGQPMPSTTGEHVVRLTQFVEFEEVTAEAVVDEPPEPLRPDEGGQVAQASGRASSPAARGGR